MGSVAEPITTKIIYCIASAPVSFLRVFPHEPFLVRIVSKLAERIFAIAAMVILTIWLRQKRIT